MPLSTAARSCPKTRWRCEGRADPAVSSGSHLKSEQECRAGVARGASLARLIGQEARLGCLCLGKFGVGAVPLCRDAVLRCRFCCVPVGTSHLSIGVRSGPRSASKRGSDANNRAFTRTLLLV